MSGLERRKWYHRTTLLASVSVTTERVPAIERFLLKVNRDYLIVPANQINEGAAMGTQLSFLTQSIVDQAHTGTASYEVRRALDELAACMLYPADQDGREIFLEDAEIRLQLELRADKKLTAKDAETMRDLLLRQREQPVSVAELEAQNGRETLLGYARGLVLAEAMETGNAEEARRRVSAEMPETFDRNFRRNTHFNAVTHLWAAHRYFRSAKVVPCPPAYLDTFLAVARAYHSTLELVGKPEADFAIPAGLKLLSRWEAREKAGKRPKRARHQPRELVKLSQVEGA